MKIINKIKSLSLISNPKFLFSIPKNINEIKNIIENIPYNFSGLELDFNIQESYAIKSTSLRLLGDDLEKGFLFAYDNLLECLVDYDEKFFESNFEPSFFKKIKEFHQNLEKNSLKLKIINENDGIETSFQRMKYLYGVNHNRFKNKGKSFHENSFKFNNMNMQVFTTQGAPDIEGLKFLIQAHILFKSKKKLIIEDLSKNNSFESNINNSDIHKIIFECEGQNMANLFGGMSNLIKTLKDETGFRNFLLGKDYSWKISDIDNFMKGNPFF